MHIHTHSHKQNTHMHILRHKCLLFSSVLWQRGHTTVVTGDCSGSEELLSLNEVRLCSVWTTQHCVWGIFAPQCGPFKSGREERKAEALCPLKLSGHSGHESLYYICLVKTCYRIYLFLHRIIIWRSMHFKSKNTILTRANRFSLCTSRVTTDRCIEDATVCLPSFYSAVLKVSPLFLLSSLPVN